jgi:hypothetical protein
MMQNYSEANFYAYFWQSIWTHLNFSKRFAPLYLNPIWINARKAVTISVAAFFVLPLQRISKNCLQLSLIVDHENLFNLINLWTIIFEPFLTILTVSKNIPTLFSFKSITHFSPFYFLIITVLSGTYLPFSSTALMFLISVSL